MKIKEGYKTKNNLMVIGISDRLSPNHLNTPMPVFLVRVVCLECTEFFDIASCEVHQSTCVSC
ncbi:hypothetical protein [Vibrio comitans]|uniref:hypothetical protein n=1 Tax=Vibrio comitans TaxID=413401 RepID=UPI001144BD90|nr:hypothetical protein [Vibrio comitans]